MGALVVFESMYGNTALVAQAIARGIGGDARAVTTDVATPELVSAVSLLVVGAPVHAMSLPTDDSRESAAKQSATADVRADLDHPSVRAWFESLPAGSGPAAAFDTRVRGPLGFGGNRAIERRLRDLGYSIAAPGEGFKVRMKSDSPERGSLLLEGELERAAAWGTSLAARVALTS